MSAPQMIRHLIDAVESGEHPTPAGTVICWLPWPKARLRSPPELLSTKPTTWQADLATLAAAVERTAARDRTDPWPESAVFGRLSERQWGAPLRTHIDHHVRQFGV
jgi:hypothetical protein